jgi:hypothetical protein
VCAHHLTEPGHLDGGRPALGHRVVRLGRIPERRPGVVQLLIAYQQVVVAGPAEGGYAVVAAGQVSAVVEHDRRLGVVE